MKEWEQTGWQVRESQSMPGRVRRLPWSHMVDRLKYDLMPEVSKLTMPVLLIVGSEDDITPEKHQKILHDALPGKKKLHVIAGAEHTFRTPEENKELSEVIDGWLKEL